MSRLQWRGRSGPAQIDDVDRAAARHKNESLIRGRIDGNAPPQGERTRGAVINGQGRRTRALQSDLVREQLLSGWIRCRGAEGCGCGVRIRDARGARIRFTGIVQFTGKGVALAARRIRNRYLIESGIVRDQCVCVRLPGHAGGVT